MNIYKLFFYLIIILSAVSCANRAEGPTGGPKDSIPPVITRTIPENGAVNYKKKEILVYFDENITVEKANENVIISPPQMVQPIVKGNGKFLSVSLQDELIENTSYSIVFNNAIVDLNEKNPYKNYTFAFATGPEIDTLQVSGKLYDAFNLEPSANIVVGIIETDSVAAIFKRKFLRITKTGDEGEFTIGNIKPGMYRLFALGDVNRDYQYQSGESVAFYDSIVIPSVLNTVQVDTIRKDSLSDDSLVIKNIIRYLPDNINLKLFKESKKRQYLVKSERPDKYRFNLFFNREQTELPQISCLNEEISPKLLIQFNDRKDSLVYWIKDSVSFKIDTLVFELKYLKTDSLFNLVSQTDTLKLNVRAVKQPALSRSEKNAEKKSIKQLLNFKTNINAVFDKYNDIYLTVDEPLDTVVLAGIHLRQKIDSSFVSLKYEWQQLDDINQKFCLKYPWKPDTSYELKIDSAAMISIYGKVNDSGNNQFKTRSMDEYSTIKLLLINPDSNLMVQVIDAKENVVMTKQAFGKNLRFEYLKPGDYFLKSFIDGNNNQIWDTGDIEKQIQPEKVFYFPKKLSIKANWEIEESWNHLDPSMLNKKPVELMKPVKNP